MVSWSTGLSASARPLGTGDFEDEVFLSQRLNAARQSYPLPLLPHAARLRFRAKKRKL